MNHVARTSTSAALVLAALCVAACGGGTVRIRDVPPRSSPADTHLVAGHIARAEVRIAPVVGPAGTAELETNDLPRQMETALTGLGSGPTAYTLVVTITQLDLGHQTNHGHEPAVLSTNSSLLDPAGVVVRQFDHHAMAMAGRRNGRLRSICEKTVRFIGEAL